MKKLLTSVIAAAVILVLTTLCVFADSAGFASESETVLAAQTPFDKKYVSIDWHTSQSETVGVPLTYKDYVLIPTLNKVNKLSEKDGKVVASVEFDEKVSENCRGVVVGDTLIQPTRTRLYFVDLGSMSVSTSVNCGDMITDIAVSDNLVYFGFKYKDKYKFQCADMSTELSIVWEYDSDVPVTSPARIGGTVVFGAGDKLIVRAENEFVENPVSAEITHVFAGEYAVFMSCVDGRLMKLRLDENGKTEEDSLLSCEIGGTLTAPCGVNNHIYVGSTEGFFVVDGLNMEIMKSFDELKNSSAPLITTGSGVRAYTVAPHSDRDGDRWYIYSILDTDDAQTTSELAKIIDFTDGKITVSQSGKMYFRDGKGSVWAASETKPNLFVNILKIVLLIAIFVMLLLFLRTWAKKRQAKEPPEY